MDEFINSITSDSESNITQSIGSDSYDGVDSLTVEQFELANNAFTGLGAAAFGVIMSIAVASLIRLFYSL